MKENLYQVDAFTNRTFGGNPAAVCLLEEWLDDETMQNIAAELNLSETAFLVLDEEPYKLRWFTPLKEVRMCGHATLATGHILLSLYNKVADQVRFDTLSGILSVTREGDQYILDLPADKPEVVFYEDGLSNANIEYESVFQGQDDYLMILKDEEAVVKAKPDFRGIFRLDKRGLIISAKGNNVDFVSRCFYPAYGIDEDPVTGSAHTLLTPYWANRLGKINLSAKQLSKRGGELSCHLRGDRIHISGSAVTVIKGSLYL